MFFHPFAATNEPDTCLWCGRVLRQLYDTRYEEVVMPEPSGPCQRKRDDGAKCGSEIYDIRYNGTGNAVWYCSDDHSHGPARKRVVKERVKFYDLPGGYGDGKFCGLSCGYQFGATLARAGSQLRNRLKSDV